MACWSGADQRVLAAVEPEWTSTGQRDYGGLIADLEAPSAYAQRMERRREAHEDGAWVREAAAAYAEKQVLKTAQAA